MMTALQASTAEMGATRRRTLLALRLALAAVLASLPAPPAGADDVYLKNGETFEGVIAIREGAQVRIQLPGGEMRLPAGQVERIDEKRSPYAEYLARHRELEAAGDARAWLELALWAESRQLAHGTKQAALAAAELEPGLPALEPLMRRLDYVYDADSGRWLPLAEHMRRRGYVYADGRWVSRQEVMAALELRRQQLALRREEARVVRESRQADRPAAAERPRAEEENRSGTPRYLVVPTTLYAVPAPIGPISGGFFLGGRGAAPAPAHQGPRLDLLDRQPGSLIPGTLNLNAAPRNTP